MSIAPFLAFGQPTPAPPSGGGGSSYGIAGEGSAASTWVSHPQTGEITTADIYVDPNAMTNGDGSSGNPFDNLDSALAVATNGDTIGIAAGTLAKASAYNISIPNLTITGLGSARPILDRTGGNTNGFEAFAFNITAAGFHLKTVEIIGVPQRTDGSVVHRGVSMQGGSFLIEDVHMHDSPGGAFYADGVSSGVFQDCISWAIGDGSSTSTNIPDQLVATSGATFIDFARCYGAWAPDDAFDLWDANNCRFLECASYKPGTYWNGNPAGDGNGYKMGGAAGSGDNEIRGSIIAYAASQGIVHNGSTQIVHYLNNTSVNCGSYGIREDDYPGTLVYENISLGNGIEHLAGSTNVTYRNNTWDLSITNAQFSDPTNFDWSLGAGSPCIGAGQGGINLGASRVALELMRLWTNYLENGGTRPSLLGPEA